MINQNGQVNRNNDDIHEDSEMVEIVLSPGGNNNLQELKRFSSLNKMQSDLFSISEQRENQYEYYAKGAPNEDNPPVYLPILTRMSNTLFLYF